MILDAIFSKLWFFLFFGFFFTVTIILSMYISQYYYLISHSQINFKEHATDTVRKYINLPLFY